MRILKFLPVLGIALFIFILRGLDWNIILELLSRTNLYVIVAILLLQVPIVLTKALKWKAIIKAYGVEFPLSRAVSSWLIGFAAGIVTPGRMGDFARVYYLRGRLPSGEAATTVAVDRIIDIFILFSLSLIGIALFSAVYAAGRSAITIVAAIGAFFALFSAGVYAFAIKGVAERLARPLLRAFVPSRHKERAKGLFHGFYKGLDIIRSNRKNVAESFLLSLVSWFLIIVQTYMISVAINIEVPFVFVASILPVITILDVLPVSFSGIGTRDAALIFFFGFLPLPPEAAVSFSLMILVFNYLVAAGAGMLLWAKNPFRIHG